MQRITLVLLFLSLPACNDDLCPVGKTRVGAACIDTAPDGGVTDSSIGVDSSIDTGGPDANSTADAAMDVCVPSPEMCNGVSDDCDDNVDEGACDFPNTQATCEPGGCVVSECDEGFLDCSEGLGCETASDRNNCGECGVVCGATEGCEAGRCVEHTLDWWWTMNGGGRVFLADGLEQRYMLTEATTSPIILTPSTGSPLTFNDSASSRAVLAAVDESGQPLWQVYISAESLETTSISSIDGVDVVFVAGSFRGTLRAGTGGAEVELNSAGTSRDGFVLRVDGAGSVRTMAHLTDRGGNDTSQTIAGIAARADGVVFAVGSSGGDFSIGGRSVLPAVPSEAFEFILRIGATHRAMITPRYPPWESIAVDDENVYVGMRLEDGVMLGGVEYVAAGFLPLIACLDHDLAFRWVETPLTDTKGEGEDERIRVHAGNGAVYVSHYLTQMHSFGGHIVAAGGYVASLLPSNGTVAWARELGVFTPAIGTAEDRVYFAGTGTGTVDLGGGSLGAAVGRDALVGSLQNSGNYESGRRFGGLDQETGSEVQPTSDGVMISGTWSGDMNVDGIMFREPDEGRSVGFVFHFSAGD